MTVGLGSFLDLHGNDAMIAALSGSGTVLNDWSDSQSTLAVMGSGSTTFSGAIQDCEVENVGETSAVNKNGNGTQILEGNNTYTGTTQVYGGTLELETPLGSLGNSFALLGNTAITVAGGTTSGGITSNGAIFAVYPGNGTIFAGTTGSGSAGASLALAPATTFDMTDGGVGTFQLQQQSSYAQLDPGRDALSIDGSTGAVTFDFDLSAGGADQLAAGGAAVVHGTNTININTSGSTSLTPGTYDLITAKSGLDGSFQFSGGSSSQTVTLDGIRYTLTLGNSDTAETVTVSGPLYWDPSGASQLGGGGTWNTSDEWSEECGGALVTWDNDGNGNAVFAGTGGTVSLATTIEAASIRFGSAGYTISSDTLALPVSGTTINVDPGLGATIDSTLAGNGGLTKTGSGTLLLGGANDYRGGTTITAGTVQLGGSSALGTGDLTVDGGALDLGGYSVTAPSLNINSATLEFGLSSTTVPNTLTVFGTAAVSGANTIDISTPGSSLTPGTYNLITAGSGLSGTFQFSNGSSSETVTIGSSAYTLTLENSDDAEKLIVSSPVPVALYWDPGTSGSGGTPTWDTSTLEWNTMPAGAGRRQSWINGAMAVFDGTGGTVNLASGAIDAAAISFDTDGYTISGNTLALPGGGTSVERLPRRYGDHQFHDCRQRRAD